MQPDLRAQLEAALGGAYAVERELGGGGMSHVFLARDTALGRAVVVKLLPPDQGAGLSADRFRREIQLAASLQHPHIVPVLSAGVARLGDAPAPYFTMPFVEGRSLRERLREGGALPVREAAGLLRQVAAALAYAHGAGVVHRDIKPDNVLVSHGAAMVTDFGVAKALSASRGGRPGGAPDEFRTDPGSSALTALGFSLGTPAYMAPEQVAGDPTADHRADLYAFGATGYELLTGAPPFAGRTPQQLLVAHLTETPRPLRQVRPDVPAALAALVERCLAKDPAARPADAAEVVRLLDEPVAAEGAVPNAPMSPPARRRARGRHFALAALAAVAAAGAGAAAWRGARSGDGPAPGTAAAAATPAAPPGTVAVLPFANVGGGPDAEYFSDGMADELTNALSKVPGIRVAARSSAFAFRGRAADVRAVGRALGVRAVVDGAVRRAGDRLRVRAELTDAADGLVLWSETYERQAAGVFEVQDDLTRAIAGALRGRLGAAVPPSGAAAAVDRGTDDLAAYDAYLRGRHAFHQRGAEALRRADSMFAQAAARDPRFARAYAGRADVAALLPVYAAVPADSAYPAALRLAERAVALDSTLAEAHTTMGLAEMRMGRWEASARAFRRALALDPRDAAAHQWYGELLIVRGRPDSAAAQMQAAVDLDPLSPVLHAELAYALALLGRGAEAERAGRRGVELAPELWTTHAFLGYAYLFTGRAAEGVASVERAARLEPGLAPVRGTLAFAYGAAGQPDRARPIAADLVAQAARPGGSAVAAALALLGTGDRDGAVAWLERAAARRDPWLMAMGPDAPFFAAVRADPRFAAAAAALGLDGGARQPPN